jgi:peptidoglycan L-alanyl-D-glutamate endopeptidase CwlK
VLDAAALMELTMLIFNMVLLFSAFCVTAWSLMFPDGRGALIAYIRRRRLIVAAVVLMVLPPAAVLLSTSGARLPAFMRQASPVNEQIAEALRGEQLVAPAALPPDVFTTAEVQLQRPMLAGANRNWALLDTEYEQRLMWVFRAMQERHGYRMVLLEGFRSPERQNQLADTGSRVTAARAFQSYHQLGLAADCAFLREGRVIISEGDAWAMRGYELFGRTAAEAGLTWGGNWAIRDFGHAELRKPDPRR